MNYRKILISGLLFCALLFSLAGQQSVDSLSISSTANELETISNDLMSIADQIENYQQKMATLNGQIQDLTGQIKNLTITDQLYQQKLTEYTQAVLNLQEQVKDYQAKVKILQANYAGLLGLSRKYQSALKASQDFNTVLLTVGGILLAAVVIETVILIDKSKGNTISLSLPIPIQP